MDVKTNSTITSNAASQNGGGIYANGGTVNFSNGVIKNNYASHWGGGLYIPATGKLTLKGTATITGNRVPAGMHGGGVYLAGVVEVGSAYKAYNCGVDAKLESLAKGSVMGGLVGKMEGGEIHSAFAVAEMTGYTMGGLVGQLTAGNLFNSFANPQFNYSGAVNAEFEALTLVDNITGVVTDMLAHGSYTFEATPEQYASRFRIVVGDYKDIEENEAPEPVEDADEN